MNRTWPIVIIVLLMALQTVAAAFLLPQVVFRADLSVESDQDPRVELSLERERAFPSPNPLVFLVKADGSVFSAATLGRLGNLILTLEKTGLPVRSIASVQVGLPTAEGRKSRPLWAPGTDDSRLEADLKAHPVYEDLFLNPARTAWVVYTPTSGDGQSEARKASRALQGGAGVVPGGSPWVRLLLDRALATNMLWLMPGALLVLYLVFTVLTRGPGQALKLTVVSCQPALGVLLLFPMMNTPFNFTTILAPLLALALATTYTIHIHHHLREFGPGWKELFRLRGRAVFWSALISALGFSSLWFSPLPALRFLGSLLAFGLVLTMFWCLVGLPLLSRILPAPLRKASPLALPRAGRWSRPALALLAVLALPGVFLLTTAFHWSDFLKNDTEEAVGLRQFEDLFPAWQESNLHLSWPGEAAWLEPGRWKALEALVHRWKAEDPAVRIWSVLDVVRGVLPELGMAPDSTDPEDLAQALEFLPATGETGKLIDGARSELVVRWAFDRGSVERKDRAAALDRILAQTRLTFPGAEVSWSGPLYRQILSLEAFLQGEIWGMAGFFLLTWLVIMAKLKSFRRGTLALVPSLVSASVFLGLAGWLGWPISPATALVAAACIGQTTDDGLLWSLLPPSREVRSSLAESTILLSSALAVLAFSTFANIAQAALLVIAALFFSTAMVLWFLPWRARA